MNREVFDALKRMEADLAAIKEKLNACVDFYALPEAEAQPFPDECHSDSVASLSFENEARKREHLEEAIYYTMVNMMYERIDYVIHNYFGKNI